MKIVQTLKAIGVTVLVAAALLASSSGALANGDAVQLGTTWTDLEVPALGAALPDLGDELAPADVTPAEPAPAEPTILETVVDPVSSGDDGVSWEESAVVAPEEPASAPAEPTILETVVEPVLSGDGVSWEE